MKRLRAGEKLKGLAGYGITPQERASLAEEALAGRKMAVEERHAGVGEREAAVREAMERKAAREETPEEAYRRVTDVASIMSAGRAGAQQTPRALNFPEQFRQNTMARLFEAVKKSLGREGLLGLGGWKEPEDLNKMIISGTIPFDKLDERSRDIINAYSLLAQGADRNPERTEEVLSALAKIGMSAPALQPETTAERETFSIYE